MEHKKSKLTLKGIDESTGIPFIKEIHSLDEVKTSGTYIVIARNATSEENGFPKIHSKADSCFCCEANLVVNCCYNDDESQSTNTYGQELTISDKENNTTGTYKRTVGPAGCSEWLMVATGSIKLVAQNNDIVKAYNEVSANLNAALERIDKAEDTVSKSHNTVLESATVRFHRIEENEATINPGEVDVLKEIVYYKPSNIFVAADSAGAYWDSWDSMDAYMSGGTIRKDKVYLFGNMCYNFSNKTLSPIFDIAFLSISADIEYMVLTENCYYNLSNGIGFTVNTKPSSLENINSTMTEVHKGDVIKITTVGSKQGRAYALTDKNRIILSVADEYVTLNNHIVVADEDGFLFVNCLASGYETFNATVARSKINNINQAVEDITQRYENIETEIGVIKKSISEIDFFYQSDIITGLYYDLSNGVGFPVNTKPSSLETLGYIMTEVHKGDIINITTVGSKKGRAYALTDKNRIILSVADEYVTLNNHIVVANEDGFLFINCLASGYETFNVSISRNKIDAIISNVVEIEKSLSSAMMYNPYIDLKKPSLKILDIGNSYTEDAQHYIKDIIQSSELENLDMSLYWAMRGGASFKTWVDCYYDRDDYESYKVAKVVGTDIEGVAGKGNAFDGSVLRNALNNVSWDIILIHQTSAYANDFSQWETRNYSGYLKEYIQILRKTNPQSAIGFLLVHSYRSTYSSNVEKSSLLRWKNIAKSANMLKQYYGIDFIIPYGTAVQNLRASSLCDEYEFSTDGTHLAEGLGDYVASCCYYQSLIAPRIGISVLGNTFRTTDLDENIAGVKNITDETAVVAQKAAMLATYNMWCVMNPDEYEL